MDGHVIVVRLGRPVKEIIISVRVGPRVHMIDITGIEWV